MKFSFASLFLLFFYAFCSAQKTATTKELPVPCNGSADAVPGKYTDHTNPKYGVHSLKGSAQDKAAMTKQLIAVEKIEETSRSNSKLTGCVARVSFNGGSKIEVGSFPYNRYGYQLALYQNVCHVTEHLVKTVGEYRSVLRVEINGVGFGGDNFYGEYGDFYVTDRDVRYSIAIDAKEGTHYDRDRFNHRSLIARYITEDMVTNGRTDNYKDYHGDFLKLINGEGYVERWERGHRDDESRPNGYQWIDRHYIISRPGIPLLVPVTRKGYLEALLQYYDIEKNNFIIAVGYKKKSNPEKASICEADKIEYAKENERKKAKVKQLLASSSAEWLQQPAVVNKDIGPKNYDRSSNGLIYFDKFYDGDINSLPLYEYNAAYFKPGAGKPLKPMFMELQIRYELGKDVEYSKRYFDNFLENYAIEALRKMLY